MTGVMAVRYTLILGSGTASPRPRAVPSCDPECLPDLGLLLLESLLSERDLLLDLERDLEDEDDIV